MGSDCYIHVFYSCPLEPATGFFKCFYSPNTSSSIKTKEIKEDTINLLFNLKVEAEINILESCQ